MVCVGARDPRRLRSACDINSLPNKLGDQTSCEVTATGQTAASLRLRKVQYELCIDHGKEVRRVEDGNVT